MSCTNCNKPKLQWNISFIPQYINKMRYKNIINNIIIDVLQIMFKVSMDLAIEATNRAREFKEKELFSLFDSEINNANTYNKIALVIDKTINKIREDK